MPNFPVHNFGMDKMLEGVQGGLGAYVKGRTTAFTQEQEKTEKEQERRFQLATKIFPLVFDEGKPYAVRKQAAEMAKNIYGEKGINIDIDVNSMLDAAEVSKNLENAYLTKMAEFVEKDDWVSAQKIIMQYKLDPNVSNKNEAFKAYEQTARTWREKKMESVFKAEETNRPLTEQEKINLRTKRDINLSPEQRVFQTLTPEQQQEKVMRPDRPEPKETGVLTEGTVKKSIDELAAFDMKTSAKLYKNYLTYRNAYTSKGLEISKAREQALSQVQQESQGISGTDNKKTYDYLWK